MRTVTNEKAKKRGEMIVVVSAKGGVGRTTLAVNLAVALTKKTITVSLLDGDFQFGDIALAMDLQPTFTIKEVAEELERVDSYSLLSYLCSHDSGVKVLPAPVRPEFADLVTNEVIDQVVRWLLDQFDYVIVDTSVGLGDKTLAIVEKADQVLVVTNLEMATLKNTKLLLETFQLLGLKEKTKLVINRATMESVIQATDVPNILGEQDPFYIPNDFQTASQSLNIGIPFVVNQGKSEMAKAIFKMAEGLTSRREIAMLKAKQPSFLEKLFQKKRLKEGG